MNQATVENEEGLPCKCQVKDLGTPLENGGNHARLKPSSHSSLRESEIFSIRFQRPRKLDKYLIVNHLVLTILFQKTKKFNNICVLIHHAVRIDDIKECG